MLQKEAVTPDLLELIRTLQNESVFRQHVLAGGTALALQIGHRRSVDIDLFTINKQDNRVLLNYFNDNFPKVEVLYNEDFSLQLIVNSIKIDLISIKGKILEIPKTIDGITLFGLADISAMKLLAITDRKEPKDYIDIAYLLKNIPLEIMLGYYKSKYNKDDVMNVKRALTETARINPYDWEKVKMLKNDIFISDIPKILKDELLSYNEKKNIQSKKTLFQKIRKLFVKNHH